MQVLLLAFMILGQTEAVKPASSGDYLRDHYADAAKKYVFHRDSARQELLDFVTKPIMRWANDDDWSGDVFVWTHAARPQVVGCILSGPSGAKRLVYHEFHLLAAEPIAPAELHTRRRWEPKTGVDLMPIDGAPKPADTATARLTQMRQLAKEFSAHMQADGPWELRLLPQPLYRWGNSAKATGDGALFGYVWTKGTDLEVLLLLESREMANGPRWHFAPVRFSNRAVWLKYGGQEIWRADSHREPQGNVTDQLYTTAYASTIPNQRPLEPSTSPEER